MTASVSVTNLVTARRNAPQITTARVENLASSVNVELNAARIKLAHRVNYATVECVYRDADQIPIVRMNKAVLTENVPTLAEGEFVAKMHSVNLQIIELYVCVLTVTEENRKLAVHHTNVQAMRTAKLTNSVTRTVLVETPVWNKVCVGQTPNAGSSTGKLSAVALRTISEIRKLNAGPVNAMNA